MKTALILLVCVVGCTTNKDRPKEIRKDVDLFVERLDLQEVRCFFDFSSENNKKARCVARTGSHHTVYFECGDDCQVYDLESVPPEAERE